MVVYGNKRQFFQSINIQESCGNFVEDVPNYVDISKFLSYYLIMNSKFIRINYGLDEEDGHERYVIIQPLSNDHPEVLRIHGEYPTIDPDNGGMWGRLVYGSRVKYEKSGRVFRFCDADDITELDEDEVMDEHFVGLI